jgi:2'-5' RNA ligase
MGLQRLFFALYPPQRTRDQVRHLLKQIHSGQLRKVAPANFHLTLSFLGMVDEAQIPCLCDAAAQVSFAPFELSLDQLGSFSRPRVLWIAPSSVPERLKTLQKELETVLADCGHQPEQRIYHPHMTLARKFKGPVPGVDVRSVPWQVDDFQLMVSESTPSGVQYLPLAVFPRHFKQ